MADAIIDFGSRRIHHRSLFGRQDVLDRLDAWLLGEVGGGWVVVSGGPGSGKSAILTHWLDRHEARGLTAPHHFADRGADADEQAELVQRSLAAQVEVLYPEQKDPQDTTARRLWDLLARVSAEVLVPHASRLILVLDDLDAVTGPLPDALPQGVWLLCSCRTDWPDLGGVTARAGGRCIDLSDPAWTASGEQALRAFWEHHASTYAPPLSADYAAEAIRRAEGNLLHAVMLRDWLHSLHPEDLEVADLAQIPHGLDGFLYATHGVIHPVTDGDLAATLEVLRERLQLRELADQALRSDLMWARPRPAELDPAEYADLQRAVREESSLWRRDPQSLPALVAQRLHDLGWSDEKLDRVLAGRPGLPAGGRAGAEVVMMAGHTSTVKACAVTPDGQRVISGSNDRTLRVWDARSGELLLTLNGHASPVADCAVTPDGGRVVSASADHTLKIWNLAQGQELRTLTGHLAPVWACALTPDGRRAVSASADHTLRIWDLELGKELGTLAGHLAPVWACAVTQDGKRVVSASADHTLRIWDLELGKELGTLAGHLAPVLACTVQGGLLVSGSADRTLKIWNLDEGGGEVATLTGHAGPVMACAVTPDGQRVVSASNDGTLKIWDIQGGRALATLAGHRGPVSACAVLPDGQRAVSASDDMTLRIWDLAGSAELVCSVTLDGKRVVSSWEHNELKIWRLLTGEDLATLTGHSTPVKDCAVMPDGRYVVSRSADDEIRVWDLGQRRCVETVHGVGGILFFSANHDRDASSKVWKLYPAAGPRGEGEKAASFPRVFGKYTLLRPLARGGMGELFVANASDMSTPDQLCVIKKLPDAAEGIPRAQYSARLLDEARLMMRLRHGNLVQVFDAGEIGGQVYLAMEYVPGRDLRAVWRRCRDLQVRIPVGTALYLASEVAQGLAFAHAYGGLHLVHRDIAPPNILCSWQGDVKIVDFGLASSLIKSGQTIPGTIYGHLGYLSPEQVVGGPADRRADVYALGVVLWELLTGRLMVDHTPETEEVLRRIHSDPPEPPSRHVPDLQPSLDAIVLRALAHDPMERFATADEMWQELLQELAQRSPGVDRSCVVHLLRGLFGQEQAEGQP